MLTKESSVTIDIGKGKWHFISVYDPDNDKSKEEIDKFYSDLDSKMEKIPKEHEVLIMGDVNARIGNIVINGIKQRFKNNEPHVNDSGQKLVEFCAQNELRINTTYFDHEPHQKI